ncbi:MAG: DUF1559 domain-containing protein, partial [Planctomycetota bacterium]
MNSDGQQGNNRFSITYLLLITWAIGISMAPLAIRTPMSFLSSLLLLLSTTLLVNRKYGIATVFLVFLLGIHFFYIGITNSRPNAVHFQCENNVKQIGLAILFYESAHKQFPPPYSVDSEGNPLHSWRVLILPYLDEVELYEKFNLDEPWDSPANLTAAENMPEVYRCPCMAEEDHPMTTSYVTITGSKSPWPARGKRSIREITDGASETILVLESPRHRTLWTAPVDMRLKEISPANVNGDAINLQPLGPPLHASNGGSVTPACFCDGHVSWLPESLNWKELKAMATSSGGESPRRTKFKK